MKLLPFLFLISSLPLQAQLHDYPSKEQVLNKKIRSCEVILNGNTDAIYRKHLSFDERGNIAELQENWFDTADFYPFMITRYVYDSLNKIAFVTENIHDRSNPPVIACDTTFYEYAAIKDKTIITGNTSGRKTIRTFKNGLLVEEEFTGNLFLNYNQKFKYDRQNRLIRKKSKLLGKTKYAYDDSNHLETESFYYSRKLDTEIRYTGKDKSAYVVHAQSGDYYGRIVYHENGLILMKKLYPDEQSFLKDENYVVNETYSYTFYQ